MSQVTRLIDAAAAGDRKASEELLPLVYEELRRLASQRLAQEAVGHTLQPTALVHEAYLRLVGPEHDEQWDHRGHFFAAAAEAMQRVLVDHARQRSRLKRGGDLERTELADVAADESDRRLLELDEALAMFAEQHPEAAKIVELRQFGGLGHEEIAAALGITVYEARQQWTFARAWLRDCLSD
jgi:RNA polymerase sigma factor (TIGR02999 family)